MSDATRHDNLGKPTHDLATVLISFCRFLRREGFNIGAQETRDALRIADQGTLLHRRTLFQGLRGLLSSTSEEWHRFEALFDRFWRDPNPEPPASHRRLKRPHVEEKKTTPLLTIGVARPSEEQEPGNRTGGANSMERLRKTDFSQVQEPDRNELEDLVVRLCRRMLANYSRRIKPDRQRIEIDLRRTIRKSLGQGGQPLHLAHRARRKKKNRLVALLDVSGSMDPYSYYLLLFIHALRRRFERVDAYVFSTRLTCVNEALEKRRFKEALRATGELAEAWSSGTQIGACLRDFITGDGRRLLTGRTVVFVLSDGLDTGDPTVLADALAYMKKRVKRLIWLNPLKGMPGYEPRARGMARALPHVDVFAAAHTIDSLRELENHLADV